MHILFIFIVGILLLNFLIALLSAVVSEVVETGDIIMMLQRIYVARSVEARIERFCPCVCTLLKKIFFRCRDKKFYIVTQKITDEITNSD